MKKFLICIITCLIGISSYTTLSYANPEKVTFKSALLWSKDGQGDELLPETIYNRCELPLPITTDGRVLTITASWEFTGEVSMEVSADNGSHWTPVTNGTPLTSLFTSGNKLKWKAILGLDSELFRVKLSYSDASGVVGSFGEPKLSGFKYRKALGLNRYATPGQFIGPDLFNYQMNIKVGEGKIGPDADMYCEGELQADFRDVRWTLEDGETVLPHYLEKITGSSPNRIAHFWVKVPQIPSQGVVLYLYYGNSQAEDLSNPEAVFDFYDDFDGAELETEKWSIYKELGGSYEVSNSRLKLNSAKIVSKAFELKNGIIESQAQSDNDTRLIVRTNGQEDMDQLAYASMYAGAEHCIAVGSIVKANTQTPTVAGTTYNYRVVAKGSSLTFERNDENFTNKEAIVGFEDTGGLSEGAIGLEIGQGNVGYYSWVRVRRHSEIEPVIIEQGGGEPTNLPEFSGVTLAGNGDVIPAEAGIQKASVIPAKAGIQKSVDSRFRGNDKGTYVSRVISTPFDTRIILPSYNAQITTQDAIQIDISADKGLHYKEDCENGKYYYVSKNDFASGRNVQYRLVIASPSQTDKAISIQEVSLDYAPGKLVVISPNGGEKWAISVQKEISWTAVEYEDTYPIKLEYSLDKGKNYKLIAGETSNDGQYLWTLPDKVSKKALIRISDALDAEVYDTSDRVFEIQERGEKEELSLRGAEGDEAISEEGEVDLEKLIEKRPAQGTKLYDVLIKLGDNTSPDPEEDSRACYKEGDIVLVRATGHMWSETERNSFLIIQLYLTEQEAQELTRPKEMPTGKLNKEGRPIMEQVRRRAKKIDLQKCLGIPEKGREREQKLKDVRTELKNKALEVEVVVEEK